MNNLTAYYFIDNSILTLHCLSSNLQLPLIKAHIALYVAELVGFTYKFLRETYLLKLLNN